MSTPAWLSLVVAVVAVLGTLGGVLITQWFAGRRDDKARQQERETEQENQWIADRRSYYLPLREAARDLEARLEHLARIYRREPGAGFAPESLSADFRELYLLSRDPIKDLYDAGADPNQPRRDEHAVQRLRTRMNRELNFATSTVYRAARFLAWAQVNRRLLDEGRSSSPRTTTSRAARFAAKVPFEVRNTVTALCTLIASLDQITALAGPPRPDQEIEPRPCPPRW